MKKYPLKFLDSYTKTDTDIFFGRDAEIEALYEMVFQTDILLVYGASGTGKTSLIQCGLASRFQSHDWLDIFVRRGNNINESLQNALMTVGGYDDSDELDLWNFDLEEGLYEATQTVELSELEHQLKNVYLNAFRPIYLIFDQFEELYILGNKAEQVEFIANIKKILSLSQPVKLIFSIREEYLGYLYDFERAVPQLLKKKLRVEPMNITKVQSVIEGITIHDNSNISINKEEIGLFTEQVFKRLQGKDDEGNQRKLLTIELPYLQVFLDEIYLKITNDESRKTNAILSLSALDNIGEIDDVLREFLEKQVFIISQQLYPRYFPLNSNHIWKILSPFVTLEGTKEPITDNIITRKIEEIFEDKNQPATKAASFATMNSIDLTKDLIEAFIKSKIIRYLENDEVYEIAHDALAAKIAEKRSDDEIALLEVKRLIKAQAALMDDTREPFTEKQLNFIAPYLEKLHLEPTEIELIEESHDKIVAEREAKRIQDEAELRAVQKQSEKDRRFSLIAAIIAIIAVISTVVALQSQNRLKEEKQRAVVSDSLAQRDKEAALIAQTNAEEEKQKAVISDSLARVREKEALVAEQLAKEKEELAKVSERKAKIALNEIAKREVKNGLAAVEQFQWEVAIMHLKYANKSEEDSIKIQVRNILTDFLVIGIYRVPPKKWKVELEPLFSAFKQTSEGIIVDFENMNGNSTLLIAFEKARQKAVIGDNIAARRDLIKAMRKTLGNEVMKTVLNKYNIIL